MTGYACSDCGKWLDTRTAQIHECLTDDYDGPADDWTEEQIDEASDKALGRYEATVYGTGGVA